MSAPTGRDRLRELLDAVLDEDSRTLQDMAATAHASPFHFTRQLSSAAGEPPVALRRRVMLERAAWQLRQGASVTDAAFAAGYESVEGFSRAYARAFGHPPSTAASSGHWLPAPNGIHFHPPSSLWVEGERAPGSDVTPMLVHHDVDDTRDLIALAAAVSEQDYRAVRMPGHVVLAWSGPEESLAVVLEQLVHTKEVWLASIEGTDWPARGGDSPTELAHRFDLVAPRWLAAVRDVERRGAWGDRLVDALCDPPESFVLGSVLAHVLTYSAHRRQVARSMLRAAGVEVDDGDPIMWLRRTYEEDA